MPSWTRAHEGESIPVKNGIVHRDGSRKRLFIFGHVRRLPESTPAHSALHLAVDARTGGKPDIRPEWKHQRGEGYVIVLSFCHSVN